MNDALWKRRKENSGDDIACAIQPAARQIGQDVPDFRLSTRLQAFAVYGPHSFKQTNKKSSAVMMRLEIFLPLFLFCPEEFSKNLFHSLDKYGVGERRSSISPAGHADAGAKNKNPPEEARKSTAARFGRIFYSAEMYSPFFKYILLESMVSCAFFFP